jgi:hypothetical protein
VNNGATTTQRDFYHVMRNMNNNGNGQAITSVTAGTPQTFRWAHKWVVGTVTQMSNLYWKHPVGHGELVVFVQDDADKTVLQSGATKASWPASVNDLNETISQADVYPNPATDHTSIAFKLESAANVNMQVVDGLGRVVYNVADRKLTPGSHNFEIQTGSYAPGLYIIKVNADGASISKRFSVVK